MNLITLVSIWKYFRNSINEKPSIYFYTSGDDDGTRRYYPANPCLQEIAKNLQTAIEGKRPWESYISEGLKHLQVRNQLLAMGREKYDNINNMLFFL